MPFDLTTIIIIQAIFFFAAFVKGVTGLGFSTMCIPLLVMVVGVKEAISLVLLPSILSNIITMRSAGHFRETITRFWPMFLATVPGLIAGLWFLAGTKSDTSAAILGIILILFALFSLFNPSFALTEKAERMMNTPVGALTGLVNGMTGSQVMPVLPYLSALHLEANCFVQALNCSFTLSSLIMIVGMYSLSILNISGIPVSVLGIAAVFLGVYAGSAIRQKLPAETFRTLILVFMILLGIALVV